MASKDKEKELDLSEMDQKGSDAISKYMIASMGAGLVPIPVVDLLVLSALQLKMVHSLANAYNVKFTKNLGKSLIGSLVGGTVPVYFAPALTSLFKLIPVIGTTTSAVTMSIVGGASTYAIGKVFLQHFASGGTMLDFDPESMRGYFAEQLEEGKKVATQVKS